MAIWMRCSWEKGGLILITHLLCVLLLDRFQIGSQVHGDFVLGAKQSPQHGISRHTDTPQRRALELATEVEHFQLQVFNLKVKGISRCKSHVTKLNHTRKRPLILLHTNMEQAPLPAPRTTVHRPSTSRAPGSSQEPTRTEHTTEVIL